MQNIFHRFNPKALTLNNAGIDINCQNQTSVDVRFWRLKSIPHTVRLKYF